MFDDSAVAARCSRRGQVALYLINPSIIIALVMILFSSPGSSRHSISNGKVLIFQIIDRLDPKLSPSTHAANVAGSSRSTWVQGPPSILSMTKRSLHLIRALDLPIDSLGNPHNPIGLDE